jgi:hypothetical protein
MQGSKMKKYFKQQAAITSLILSLFSSQSFAVAVGVSPNLLPGSVLPERAGQNLEAQPVANPQALTATGGCTIFRASSGNHKI